MPQFASVVNSVLLAIVNRNLLANDEIAGHLGQAKVIIDYALDVLEARGLFKVAKTMGGGAHVHDVSVRARRAASEIET